MTTTTFTAHVEDVPLYKYLPPKWAAEMISAGSVLIGTLESYRALESKDFERGDSGEGTREIHSDRGPRVYSSQNELPSFARSQIILKPGAKLVIDGPYEIRMAVRVDDVFVYCVTEEFDEKPMHRFGGACVRIDNHRAFFEALCVTLCQPAVDGVSSVGNGMLARCTYVERRQHHQRPSRTHECFLKPPSYAHQAEVRAVWQPTSRPIRPMEIQCPDAVRYCSRVR